METKADWLRSEIEKLEGMKKIEKDEQREIVLDNGGKVKGQTHYPNNVGWNQALTSIITRYKEELKVLTEHKQISVNIPSFITLLYNTPEQDPRKSVSLDAELVPEIFSLWKNGIRTTGCCSGHGDKSMSYIGVVDEDIPKMKNLGYETAPHPHTPRVDNFFPKTI